MKKIIFFAALAANICFSQRILFAQDDFSFGFGADGTEAAANNGNLIISGEVGARYVMYLSDTDMDLQQLGGIFNGKLNVKAESNNAAAFIGVRFDRLQEGISSYRDVLDEVYVQGFFGPAMVEGGLRKLTWGKADSFGPNDCVNAHDYRDLLDLSSPQKLKIASPLLHIAYRLGDFSKLEAVFVPTFTADSYARAGRWAPEQITSLPAELLQASAEWITNTCTMPSRLQPALYALNAEAAKFKDLSSPYTESIEYAQGGLRYTTNHASFIDAGYQYYYGRFTKPSISVGGIKYFWNNYPASPKPVMNYDSYHMIGADAAFVLGKLNMRAEAAMFFTQDMKGNDGAVRNPEIAYSLGFDCNLFAGINVNLQTDQRFILFAENINTNRALDCQADEFMPSRLTVKLAKKLLRDELEISNIVVISVDETPGIGCVIIPALRWTRGDIGMELAAGLFYGENESEFGQYNKNTYIKAGLSYAF
jgi:hypothetical protein